MISIYILTHNEEIDNRYSTDEAAETIKQLNKGNINWSQLFFGKSEVDRRRALKDLSLRLPFRPLIRWIYMYFILGGIWDGKAGFAWCTLQAFYEYLIVLKVEEIQASLPSNAVANLNHHQITEVDKENVLPLNQKFIPQICNAVVTNTQPNIDLDTETKVNTLLPSSVIAVQIKIRTLN